MTDFIMIAHRGASGYELENSMSAFDKAVKLKADFLETDIQITKDKVLVCNHWNNLYFVTKKNKLISNLTYNELNKIKLRNGESIPTVNELLDKLQGKIKFNLQIKANDIEKKLVFLINKYDLMDDVVFSAFKMKSFRRIKQIEPKSKFQILSFLPYRIFKLIFPFKKLKTLGVESINPLYTIITKGLVREAHLARLKIYPWTVNNKEIILKLKDKGVDGIITNYPDILTR